MKLDLKKYQRVDAKPCVKCWSLGTHDVRQETYTLGGANNTWKTVYTVYKGTTSNYDVKNGKKPIAMFSTAKEAKEFAINGGVETTDDSITAVINKLESIRKKHGNLRVFADTKDGGIYKVNALWFKVEIDGNGNNFVHVY